MRQTTVVQIGIIAAFALILVVGGAWLLKATQPAGPERASQPQPAAVRPTDPDFAKPLPAAAPASQASVARPAATPATMPGATTEAVTGMAPAPMVIKRVLPITGPIKYGQWHWDEAGVPPGPVVITVDLDARVLSIFRGGYEIGATAVLLGTQEKPTPLGLFPIKWKKAEHYSRTYDNAPMPYTLRLTDDGVAIHGTKVEKGYASHGCVGVPTPFAKKLFAATAVGDRVYITKGKRIGQGDSLTGP